MSNDPAVSTAAANHRQALSELDDAYRAVDDLVNASDDEVIRAIRSIPVHYAELPPGTWPQGTPTQPLSASELVTVHRSS